MQRLLQATKSLSMSQDLLKQSVDFARGSGQSLETVILDISNAYVGNNKGLKKYTLGLSAAELKTASFDDVLKAFNKNFSGANAAYLKTYAGPMSVLTAAAEETKKSIGKGLVDSLILIAVHTSLEDLAKSMESLADFTADAVYGFGSLVAQMKNLQAAAPSWLTSLLGKIALFGPVGDALKIVKDLSAYGNVQRNKKLENPSTLMFKSDMANLVLNNKKLVVDKKILDTTKKRLAEEKKAAMAKKQAALFDLEEIGLVAALQGKITEEEKLRLNLQLALLTGNDELATKLSAQLANSIDKTGKLAKDLTTLPDAKNPVASWSASLDLIL